VQKLVLLEVSGARRKRMTLPTGGISSVACPGWHRHPRTIDRLKKKLKGMFEKTGKKASVVTHSMGGLLFKSLVALDPDFVATHVSKWVAIAAPFRGEATLKSLPLTLPPVYSMKGPPRLAVCNSVPLLRVLSSESLVQAGTLLPRSSPGPVAVVAGAPGFITDTLPPVCSVEGPPRLPVCDSVPLLRVSSKLASLSLSVLLGLCLLLQELLGSSLTLCSRGGLSARLGEQPLHYKVEHASTGEI